MFKKILLNSIIIFVLSFLLHSLYNYLPCFITSIFVPVNESIWEHMKMIFSAYMLYLLIKILFFKPKEKNLVSSFVLGSLFNIIIFLIIYVPINSIFGENMIVTLIIYFITILITNYFILKFQEKKNNKKLNKIMAFLIIAIYLIFTILTYYPIKGKLFFDYTTSSYGINRKID